MTTDIILEIWIFTTCFIPGLKTVILGDVVFKIVEHNIINIYSTDLYTGPIFERQIFGILLDFFIGIRWKSDLRIIRDIQLKAADDGCRILRDSYKCQKTDHR